MTDLNDLPDNVEGGDPGHTSAHEIIHEALKIFKLQVDTMLTLLNGVGQQGVIDDEVAAPDSTWSSQKTSSEIDKKADNIRIDDLDRFLMYDSERDVWFALDDETASPVDPPKQSGLQEMGYSTYIAAISNAPGCVESRKVVPGTLVTGISEIEDGFIRTPETDLNTGALGLNRMYIYAATLDTASSAGPVTFRMYSENPTGGASNTINITIPEGAKYIRFDDNSIGIMMHGEGVVADIINAGTGASGLTVHAVRQ